MTYKQKQLFCNNGILNEFKMPNIICLQQKVISQQSFECVRNAVVSATEIFLAHFCAMYTDVFKLFFIYLKDFEYLL